MSFSINFSNNLIENYPTSAASAIIKTEIVHLDGDDHLRPLKKGGVKNWWGSTKISCGEAQHGELFY